MGLYKFAPEPSGRMGILWTVGTIGEAAVIEFGSMGHTLYSGKWMSQAGISNRAKIFATHIDEKEIALGITARLENAIAEIVAKEKPKAIFVLPSTIPETIGMDIEAICEELQYNFEEIPIITFHKGGFKEKLHHGVEEGLYQIVKRIPKNIERNEIPTFNIVGSCVDFSHFEADVEEIRRIMQGAFHMDIACVLSSNTTISQIESMGQAHINLVIREEGIKAAKLLEQRFGTPYLVGRPYGFEGTRAWIYEVGRCLNKELDETFVENEIEESKHQYHFTKQILPYSPHKGRFLLGAHYNIVEGISRFATEELGMKKGYVWCEQKSFATEAIPYLNEEEWLSIIESEENSIIMGNKTLVAQTSKNSNFILTRGLNSWDLNPYVQPFVGFRGARNLCDLWLHYLS